MAQSKSPSIRDASGRIRDIYMPKGVGDTTTAAQAAARNGAMRWFKFRLAQVTTSPINIFTLGDSTMEGARAAVRADRWVEKLLAKIRAMHQPAGIAGGVGYTPIQYVGGVPFQPNLWTYRNMVGPGAVLSSDTFGGSGELSGRKSEVGGHTWTPSVGAYTVSGGNALNNTVASSLAYLTALSPTDREVTISIKVGTLADATARVIRFFPLCTSDVTSRIYVEGTINNTAQSWKIGRQVAGVPTDLLTGWVPAGTPANLSDTELTLVGKLAGLDLTISINGDTKTFTLTQAEADAVRGTVVGIQNVGTGGQIHDVMVTSVADSEVTVGVPTLLLTHGLGLRALVLGGDVDSAQMTFTGTAVDVVYTKRSTGGDMLISIDGGAPVTVSTYAAVEANGQKHRIGGLASGSHTIKISSATEALVEGVFVMNQDETAGVRLWEGAHVGYNTRSFRDQPKWANSLKNLVSPDLAIIALGLNDYAAQTIPPSEFKANIKILIGKVREANPLCSIVLHNSYKRGDTVPTLYQWVDFVKVLNEIAVEDGVLVIDLDAQMKGWDLVDPALRFAWDADKVHLVPAGYTIVANAIHAAITQA